MFQRLKGAIDSRIAEEQARQKAATPAPVSRSASTARRLSSRTDSPSAKPRRPRPREDAAPARGPDPSEFETAFVIEDESEDISRVGTPTITDDKVAEMPGSNVSPGAAASGEADIGSEKVTEIVPSSPSLPLEVRTKLRKLEKLESRYQELLKSYRIAHARAVSIEPFEKTLKEHTPLATISDPDALVEYLSQLNLKGDMVMDELKRVSTDRDNYKNKYEEAERQTLTTQEELAKIKASTVERHDGATEKADSASIDTPSASVKSPVSSVLGGLFSPKQKPTLTTDNKDVSEEFFSYDDEIPQLQAEVKEKTAELEELRSKVSILEGNLATAQESSSRLVDSLENATRELNLSRDATKELQSHQGKVREQNLEIQALAEKLQTANQKIATLETDLVTMKAEADQKIASLEVNLGEQTISFSKDLKLRADALEEAIEASTALKAQITSLEELKTSDTQRITQLSSEVKTLSAQIEETPNPEVEDAMKSQAKSETTIAPPAAGGTKKKNKKKKKGANVAVSTSQEEESHAATHVTGEGDRAAAADGLQAEISKLKQEVADRDNQIARLQSKRKTEEELREELENMQDNFLSIGQDHVEAKDKIKSLLSEKRAFEEKIASLEKEIEACKAQLKSSGDVEARYKSLTAEFDELKVKSATLQTDLGAAQQLATSRYRDLADLRDVLQKAQPELKSLRAENANLKATKDELTSRTSELRRLEAREKDLKADMALFKKQAADRDTEMRTLNEKITQETNGRLKAEDQARIAQRDLRRSEAEKIQFSAAAEKSGQELARVQEDSTRLRSRVSELEDQVQKLGNESESLREEVELRGSQYKNAQGLLGSMRDQAGEMAMQLKEAKEQTESLEEELGEVQRLLSERTREGETMRRLLADVDDRADAKVRDMRERMEAAIEERDRAEDEASTNGRRRAREVDELKSKIRDYERDIKRAVDDRDELARSEKEWKRKRDELESSADSANKEADEARGAMSELRSALDGSEKQVRDAEKQRADLRRILDEANQRYEKLQKEFRVLQSKQARLGDISSSRSSTDSGRAGVSPANGAIGPSKMDYVYLKTILLQFLEQKDKKRRIELVHTVLGQLLQFDKKDQEKWIAAISAK